MRAIMAVEADIIELLNRHQETHRWGVMEEAMREEDMEHHNSHQDQLEVICHKGLLLEEHRLQLRGFS
jgi:hypothetical protein